MSALVQLQKKRLKNMEKIKIRFFLLFLVLLDGGLVMEEVMWIMKRECS